MTTDALPSRDAAPPDALSPAKQLSAAREIVRREAVALWQVSNRIDESMHHAIAMLLATRGSVIVTGMGKAGLIGQKLAATLSSTGTRSHFMHPAEAFHGDLGRVHHDDVVVMLTQSGETDEVVQLLPSLRDFGTPIISITASRESTVGRSSAIVLELGELDEACSLGLAPSTSTTAMLAVGDALALVVSNMRGFRAEDFARFHPGGSLGRKLSKVDDCMRTLAECRVARQDQSVREVIVACSRPGRRSGAIMLTDPRGRLTGLFTDSDLARLFERRDEQSLDRPIAEVMIASPRTIQIGSRMGDAVRLLAERKISELPVVNAAGEPLGMIDVTDIVGRSVDDSEEQSARDSKTESLKIYNDRKLPAAG